MFCGVFILYEKVFFGYLDVDVVLYVLMDVLFVICGVGDIGDYFLLFDL